MSKHIEIEAIGSTILLGIAAVTPNETVQIFALCGLGGALGGFVGAAQFPTSNSKKLAVRWLVNFALALFVAPAIATWLSPSLPHIPIHMLCVLVGGTIAVSGVGILNIALPMAFNFLTKWIAKNAPNPDHAGADKEPK